MQRTFIPGSQWLYFKLYTGHKTSDEILTQAIYPYVMRLYAEGLIDGHFFIRYSDPDFHIRFRLHIADDRNYSEIFREFTARFQPYVDNKSIVKIMCDTYVREIERYGAETIELAEELFSADSLAVMKLLVWISGQPATDREAIRWQTSLRLLDDTLSAFGVELPEKLRLMRHMSDNFKREFGFTSHAYTKQLNDKYRAERKVIEQSLSNRGNAEEYTATLDERKLQITRIAGSIGATLLSSAEAGGSRDNLLFSIQHMTMNRWFRSQQRVHELVVYDFMCKYYESATVLTRMKEEVPENLKE